MNIQPAINLLASRRTSNGYAELPDLAIACGINPDEPDNYSLLHDLHEYLARSVKVAIERPIGTDDCTKYRLRA